MSRAAVLLVAVLAFGLIAGACGEGEPPTRPSDLEIIDAVNEDLGLRIERPEDPILLEEEYPEAVVRGWVHRDSARSLTVSQDGWTARVLRAEESLQPDEWIVAEWTYIEGISDSFGNEQSLVTVRAVARFAP